MRNNSSRKWWVLGALTFGLLAVSLDMTILNVALPTLANDLEASTSDLQWIVDSYNLVLAAALLPAGMLGDRFGRKKFLLASLILFGAASAGCAMSDTPSMLVLMRCFLGLGAAFLMPLSMSILPVLFQGAERTKAMMIWAMANMFGIPLGPILGGWLLKHYAWGSVFLINLPLVAIALIAVGYLLSESKSAARHRLDGIGMLTSSLGLTGVTYGVIRAGEHGWSDSAAAGTLAAGLVLLILFVVRQFKAAHPLIDLSLFRSARFTWGTVLATTVTFAIFGLMFAMPQYFQIVQGADSLGTGLRLLPLIGGLIFGAKAAQSLIARCGAKLIAAIGFALLAAGLAIGSATGADSGYGFAAAWITVSGFGLGMALPTSMDAALGELSAERSGVGSALIMALRQVGGTFGVALLGSAMNAAYRSQLDLSGVPEPAAETVRQGVAAGTAVAKRLNSEPLLDSVRHAFVSGMGIMLLICGGIAVVGMALALLYLPRTAGERSAGSANEFGA
ncbi:DHA2 family efflux MFS transporter permease subunit [Paenibacillus contaminans]|uniref:MFS transporter n=1 Tax=Paenibacillus contaminans TaxID=450362 RepID=A0A329MGP1_9BACL|nr:DHA2 family efflux MFS transporter permease subunit [Paenibacillus contaminans]RAV18970.1 MFS transporter [Paenibacillus contaminans]